jgi:hypothetical protein
MSPDALSLLACLEELYGAQVQVFEGVVYLGGQRFNMAKLERDFHAWQSTNFPTNR